MLLQRWNRYLLKLLANFNRLLLHYLWAYLLNNLLLQHFRLRALMWRGHPSDYCFRHIVSDGLVWCKIGWDSESPWRRLALSHLWQVLFGHHHVNMNIIATLLGFLWQICILIRRRRVSSGTSKVCFDIELWSAQLRPSCRRHHQVVVVKIQFDNRLIALQATHQTNSLRLSNLVKIGGVPNRILKRCRTIAPILWTLRGRLDWSNHCCGSYRVTYLRQCLIVWVIVRHIVRDDALRGSLQAFINLSTDYLCGSSLGNHLLALLIEL
jgi:hypothetical protein